MANVNAYIQTFAGGEFGDAMSARVSIDAYQASCEISDNWLPMAQGPMLRRPSLSYLDSFADSTKEGVFQTFEFDVGQNYLLLLTNERIDFYLNDGLLTSDEVSASITNGTFGNFSGWTDASGSGAVTSASGGELALESNGAAFAVARTTFTVSEANDVHVLIFEVTNGPVNIRVGTSAGAGDLMKFSGLKTGQHRLAFTPTSTGTTHLQFSYGDSIGIKYIDNVSILTGPDFYIETPWAENDLREVRCSQDGDRLFMFHRDYAPRVLERRGHRSWSLIKFEPDDGPFQTGIDDITMTPGARYGETTMTSSVDYFDSDDVRRLIRITQPGQYVRKSVNGSGVYTDPIKVTGIGIDRIFGVAISGTFTGTIVLERSSGNENDFAKVLEYTSTVDTTYNDSWSAGQNAGDKAGASDDLYNVTDLDDNGSYGRLDNTTQYYRLAVYDGDWSSGTANLELEVDSGSQIGVARIIGYNSATSVDIEVLSHFSETGANEFWDIGTWTADEEYPDVTAFAHGRLWTFRRKQIWSSVSDDYFSFQDGVNADQSVQLTLRSKSAEGARWAAELDFLCVGTRNEEYVIRSTNLSEPVGPTTTEPTLSGEEGGAKINAQIGGSSIVYVQRAGRRINQFTHNPRALSEGSFVSVDLTRLNPEVCEDGVIALAIQQEPERRIFAVLKSGIVKTALFRREEEIIAWTTIRTDGMIEDVAVLTESDEDAVYFIVRRNIGGTWIRMIERLGSEIVLNDEDRVHLDSMLETAITRPDVGITPTSIGTGAVTVNASDDVFSMSDEGKILWVNGGKITIDSYVNATQITGTITRPLRGKLNQVTGDYEVAFVPPGRWGIADAASSVSGLDHLEGETVHIWADLVYQGTATVSSGQISLPSGVTASRIFVGLNFTSLWKGLKLAYGGNKGTAINQPKQVKSMGLLLSHASDCINMGDTPGKLKPLTKLSTQAVGGGTPWFFEGEAYEPFNGQSSSDPRIIIATVNPGPATIKALIPGIETHNR